LRKKNSIGGVQRRIKENMTLGLKDRKQGGDRGWASVRTRRTSGSCVGWPLKGSNEILLIGTWGGKRYYWFRRKKKHHQERRIGTLRGQGGRKKVGERGAMRGSRTSPMRKTGRSRLSRGKLPLGGIGRRRPNTGRPGEKG